MNFDELKQEMIKLRVSDGSHFDTVLPSNDPVGKFVLTEELSRGSMSSLYKATVAATGAGTALKILKMPASSRGTFKKRLKFELDAVSRLSHPSIVQILESGETADGRAYIATEYLDDPTLFDILHSKGNLDRTTVLGYLTGACEALAHAHANGVMHRKLSANKIFISEVAAHGEHVRLAGFGTGWIGDSGKADPRDDVLAFGRIMQEAFTALPTSAELASIIAFCIAEHSVERYSDCGEVLQNLLLVNQGKVPAPPKNRPGQSWIKPSVVAAIIMAAVSVTTFVYLQTQKPTPPAAMLARPVTHAVQTVKKEMEKPSAPEQSPLTAEQARNKYGLNDTTTATTKHLISKEAVKSAAATGAISAGAAYQSLSAEQRRKAQQAALKGATSAAKKWQSLTPETKQSLKAKSAGLAGKAAAFWKRAPKD